MLNHLKGQVDDGEILQEMETSVTKEEYPDAKAYYGRWKGCLNYKLIHQGMAQDVRDNLANQPTPDVVIMVVGKAHLQGLSQQLPEFADLQKLVVQKSGFHLDDVSKQAIVPPSVTQALRLRVSFFEAEKLLRESSPLMAIELLKNLTKKKFLLQRFLCRQ